MKTISQLGPPPTHITQEALEYILPPHTPFTLGDVECPLCLEVLVRPLQLPCGAHCCTSCVCAWVQHTITLDPLPCPCCIQSHALDTNQIMAAPSVLLKLLESLLVCCRRCGKKVVGAAEKHLQHLESGCKLHLVLTDKDPTPTSHTISASPPDNILTLATRGRVRRHFIGLDHHLYIL